VANGEFCPAALTKGMRRHAKSPLMHKQQYYQIKRHASGDPFYFGAHVTFVLPWRMAANGSQGV
jgi:hypothetical protein